MSLRLPRPGFTLIELLEPAQRANFALCDGSVRFLRYSAESIMPALASRAGGEVASIPE